MMESQPLTPQLLEDNGMPPSSACALNVCLSVDGIDVSVRAVDPTASGAGVVSGHIDPDNTKGWLLALSDAVYDNPLLLCDFASTTLLVDTRRYMIVPAEMTDEPLSQQMMSVLWPTDDYETMADGLTDKDTLLWAIDRDILGFLRRTFVNIDVRHRLTPVVTSLYTSLGGCGQSCMYVYLHSDSIDIVYMRDGRLAVVNTFDTPSVTDMMYYIMAAASASEFSAEHDRMELQGNIEAQRQLVADLRRYVRNVVSQL